MLRLLVFKSEKDNKMASVEAAHGAAELKNWPKNQSGVANLL